MEPINRPDGRHWCNPASADPADSPVTCPDCETVWYATRTNFGVEWENEYHLEQRRLAEEGVDPSDGSE